MSQADLFAEVAELPPSKLEARDSYRELSVIDDGSIGCAECIHADWTPERCRLTRRKVDIDLGTCSEVKA